MKILGFVTKLEEELKYPCIWFQNTCDQDYKLEEYDDITFAEEIFKEVFGKDIVNSDEEDKISCNKRSFVYSEIENKLDIKRLIWNFDQFDNEEHFVIKANLIGGDKLTELNYFLNELIKENYEKLYDELEEEETEN